MVDGCDRPGVSGGRLLYSVDDENSVEGCECVFCGSVARDGGHLSFVYFRQYCIFEASSEKEKILLSDEAFYQRVRVNLPYEAKRGGAG